VAGLGTAGFETVGFAAAAWGATGESPAFATTFRTLPQGHLTARPAKAASTPNFLPHLSHVIAVLAAFTSSSFDLEFKTLLVSTKTERSCKSVPLLDTHLPDARCCSILFGLTAVSKKRSKPAFCLDGTQEVEDTQSNGQSETDAAVMIPKSVIAAKRYLIENFPDMKLWMVIANKSIIEIASAVLATNANSDRLMVATLNFCNPSR
jgi:hypothetical protein